MKDGDEAAARVEALLGERIGRDLVSVGRPQADTLLLTIEPGAVRAATQALIGELGARFLVSVGTDRRPVSGDFSVTHLFSLDQPHVFVVLECSVVGESPEVDSITPLIPGAAWSEREIRDVVGVSINGLPDSRRLLLPDDWPEGVYPLRRDFPYNERPPAAEGTRPVWLPTPEGASVVTLGPFFPVLEEPSNWRLFVEGETVVGCDYRGFYNHRGVEKLGDSVMTYNEIPYLAERICGICGFIHSTCYCQAVERAAGIEVPRRARYIRTIMLELERIHSHLLWLGIAGHILGFDTVLMQTWRIREPVMWLAEAITGNRKSYGMNTIGGVRRDVSDVTKARILEVLGPVEQEATAVRDAVVGDTTLLMRTRNVGILENSWAKQVCVVGPPARGSGVRIDARIDHPYAAYDEVVPRLCAHDEGDIWARLLVRVEELFDSIRLVREAAAGLPDGPIVAEIAEEIPSGRVGVSTVEAPRGEAVHYVLTGGDNRPWRWRVRAPTYPNLQAMPAMAAGANIADVPITLGSLDPCFSCTERMETVDVHSRKIRVYSPAELLAMSRRASGAGGGS